MLEGKRTFWVAIASLAAVTVIVVAGMLTKVLSSGEQIQGIVEWAIPWILGLFGIRTGVEYFKKKGGDNGGSG